MADFIQVGVIGLGKFGFKFGEDLINMGVNVLGIDQRPDHVKRAKNVFTEVMQAEAADKEALIQMGVAELTHVLVSVGDSIAASAMISMYLKELEVPIVWVKAVNENHGKLLKKIGVDKVVIPEHMAAKELVNRITIPGFIDSLPFDDTIVIKEIVINKWRGMSLKDIDLSNRYGVQAIGIKAVDAGNYTFVPKADYPLKEGDRLMIIGETEKLSLLKP